MCVRVLLCLFVCTGDFFYFYLDADASVDSCFCAYRGFGCLGFLPGTKSPSSEWNQMCRKTGGEEEEEEVERKERKKEGGCCWLTCCLYRDVCARMKFVELCSFVFCRALFSFEGGGGGGGWLKVTLHDAAFGTLRADVTFTSCYTLQLTRSVWRTAASHVMGCHGEEGKPPQALLDCFISVKLPHNHCFINIIITPLVPNPPTIPIPTPPVLFLNRISVLKEFCRGLFFLLVVLR